jgi:hypothetical protein
MIPGNTAVSDTCGCDIAGNSVFLSAPHPLLREREPSCKFGRRLFVASASSCELHKDELMAVCFGCPSTPAVEVVFSTPFVTLLLLPRTQSPASVRL